MTTAGFVSGTREDATPSACSRMAAGACLLLGGVLLDALPHLVRAAFYLAVLAGVTAVVAIAVGYLLWLRVTLVVRTVAALTAGGALTGAVLQLVAGLPGLGELGPPAGGELAMAVFAAGAALAFLSLDALRRRPEPVPDQPYAL